MHRWYTRAVAVVTRDAGAGRPEVKPGAGEVAERLRTLAVLPEDLSLSLVLSTYIIDHNHP